MSPSTPLAAALRVARLPAMAPALFLLLLCAPPVSTQEVPVDPRGTWVPLSGSGPTLAVSDLGDLVPGDSSVYSFFDPSSGLLRTLSRTGPASWSAGPAWFVDAPAALGLRVDSVGRGGRGERATLFQADEGAEGTGAVALRRLSLPRRTVEIGVDPRPGGSHPDPFVLEGELILPEGWTSGSPPLPTMVMIHGSGPATRELPRPVAELFAQAGVAAFVYDKRGTGASGGRFGGATVADFAHDAAAVVAAVAALPEVDAGRVGVMLSSEGGLLLPEIHAALPDLAAIVCRVCPVRSGAETSELEARGRIRSAGLPHEAEEAASRFVRLQQRYARTGQGHGEFVEYLEEARGSAWLSVLRPQAGPAMPPDARGWRIYRDFIDRDPWQVYRTTSIPVLAVYGALDERVPFWGHGEPLGELLETQARPESRVLLLENATHGLLLMEEGTPPFRRVVPGWHGELVDWVASVLAGPEAGF